MVDVAMEFGKVMQLAILEVRTFDDPVLRKKARQVLRVNNAVRKILDDMLDTMRDANGVGLAAPQVGVSKRLIVVDVGEGPYFLVNPEVVSVSSETEIKWEGCLSWPGYIGEVERPVRVSVKGKDRDGHDIWVEGEGLLARALLHEIDHLNGVLFIDRAKTIAEVPREDTVEVAFEAEPQISCVFMGSPEFAVPSLEELFNSNIEIPLVITQPDRPYGRRQILKPTPVKERAVRLGLEVMTPKTLRSPDVIEKIKSISPDFITVVAYGQKLPSEILKIPKYACLNVHPSLLPKYRGGNPIQRQLMSGEKITGVTVIYMNKKMDAGDICVQKSVDVGPNETYGTLEKRLSVIGARALLEAMYLVYSGSAKRLAQDESKVTYAPHLKPGEELINWCLSATDIHNLVRALSPAPGAVTRYGDERIKVWETRLIESGDDSTSRQTLQPGTILGIEKDMIRVQCGKGVIGICEVQPAGKRRMSAKAFLAGRQRGTTKFG